MLQNIIKEIMPIIITAIVAILTAIIKNVGDAVVSFVEAKKEAVALKIGADKYNQELAFAKNIWNIVEEYFRINMVVGNQITQKQDMFDKLLKEKVPYLTDAEIIQLRQTVAGEVNKGKEIVIKPAEVKVEDKPVDIPAPIAPDAQAQATEVKAQ